MYPNKLAEKSTRVNWSGWVLSIPVTVVTPKVSSGRVCPFQYASVRGMEPDDTRGVLERHHGLRQWTTSSRCNVPRTAHRNGPQTECTEKHPTVYKSCRTTRRAHVNAPKRIHKERHLAEDTHGNGPNMPLVGRRVTFPRTVRVHSRTLW